MHGEDVAMLNSLLEHDARLMQIVDPHSYICVRHGSNVSDALAVWRWLGESSDVEQYIPEEDRAFYAQFKKR